MMNDKIYNFIDSVYNLSKKKGKKLHESFTNTDSSEFKKIWTQQCGKYNIDEQPSILPAADRIIVIGDLHGDINTTIDSLVLAKVIDKKYNWIGGRTVIVQVGDQIDRCRFDGVNSCNQPGITHNDEDSDIKILHFFTDLHRKAQLAGGAVYSLLGNHELMNVEGDMRYVSHAGIQGLNNHITEDKKVIKDGMEARKYLFTPGNPVSNFLACTRQVAIIIGSNLFVHAGILPHIADKYKIQDINKLMSLYLLNKLTDDNDYNKIFKNYEASPLWTRKIGKLGLDAFKSKYTKSISDNTCDEILSPLTKNYKVQNIYVGHTPLLESGITSICNDKIWLTDYGGSKAFDKYSNSVRDVQVLEILNDNKFNILK